MFSRRSGRHSRGRAGGASAPPSAATLTAPSNGSTLVIGETITVSATTSEPALDRIDWIASSGGVETVIATDSTSPYSQTPTISLAVGSYTIFARSIKGSQQSDSAPVSVTIAAPHLESQIYFSGTPTFTPPTDVLSSALVRNQVLGQCWGAGAGGTTNVGAGGGGEFRAGMFAVTPGVGVAISVAAGAAANTNGAASTIATTAVVANGGLSGANGSTGGTGGTGAVANFNGGNGGNGTGSRAGGGGAGSLAAGSGAAGGSAEGGSGANGTTGRALGNGGGSTAGGGATGARGEVRLDYVIPASAGFARRTGYAVTRDAAGVNSRSANMPSGIVVGEKLLLIVAVDCVAGAIDVSVSGWTQLGAGTFRDGTNAIGIAAFYKTAAGGDTATVETRVGGVLTACESSMLCTRYANAGTPEINNASGNSTNANPPSITPSGGSGNYLVVAAAAIDFAGTSIGGIPTNYTGGKAVYPSTDNGAILLTAHRAITGTSEDPGVFTNGSEQWSAVTIAIPYAA